MQSGLSLHAISLKQHGIRIAKDKHGQRITQPKQHARADCFVQTLQRHQHRCGQHRLEGTHQPLLLFVGAFWLRQNIHAAHGGWP